MVTIAQQLEQLQKDKHVLVENLNSVFVDATDDETFTELAVKVKDATTQGPNPYLIFSNYNSEGFPTKCVINRTTFINSGNTALPEALLYSTGPSYANISELILPEGLTHIKQSALKGLSGLTTFNFPSSLVEISGYAFENCTSLKSLVIPDNVKYIWDSAFSGCSKLETIEIVGNGKLFYNHYHFSDCTKLKTITLPEDKTSLNTGFLKGCSSLTTINGWDNITYFGNYCLRYCSSLAYSALPPNLTSISTCAFEGCTNVTFTTIPSGVTTIGQSAFKDCTGLTELTILGDITKLFGYAFQGCSNLSKIVLPNITTVPTCENTSIFTSTPIASGTGSIYMPDDLVETAKTTYGWKSYAGVIKPISELEAE